MISTKKHHRDLLRALGQMGSTIEKMYGALPSYSNIDDVYWIGQFRGALSDIETAIGELARDRKCMGCGHRIENPRGENRFIFTGLKEDGPCKKGHTPDFVEEKVMGLYSGRYIMMDCSDFKATDLIVKRRAR